MKKLVQEALSYIPTSLPVGMTDFEKWSKSIIDMSKVPDNDSTRFAVAVMVLHLDSSRDRKPKRYFIKSLNKSAANECANAIAMGLKEKQQAAAKAEAERKLQESVREQQQATGAPNGSQGQEATKASS